jgi:hypothetical protein
MNGQKELNKINLQRFGVLFFSEDFSLRASDADTFLAIIMGLTSRALVLYASSAGPNPKNLCNLRIISSVVAPRRAMKSAD